MHDASFVGQFKWTVGYAVTNRNPEKKSSRNAMSQRNRSESILWTSIC